MQRSVQIEYTTIDELVSAITNTVTGCLIDVSTIENVPQNQKQAAKILGISQNTLLKYVERGEISSINTGKTLMFDLQHLFRVRTSIERLKYSKS